MRQPGLEQVRVEQTSENKEYTSGEHFWNWLMNSNPIPGMVLASLKLSSVQPC